MAPFEWAKNFDYEVYEKNVMEDILLDLLNKIQNKIDTYCSAVYTGVKSSYNSGYSLQCNDTGGSTECSCDEGQVYCYPANCTTDTNNNCSSNTNCPCNACDAIYNEAEGGKNDICNTVV